MKLGVLEVEMLALIGMAPGGCKFGAMFEGFHPRWAVDATDSVLHAGLAVSDAATGKLRLTDAGRAALAAPAAERVLAAAREAHRPQEYQVRIDRRRVAETLPRRAG